MLSLAARPSPRPRSPRRCPRAILQVERLESRELLHGDNLIDLELYLPPQHHLIQQGRFLTGPAPGTALDIARAYLTSRAADLGLTRADLAGALVTRNYVSDLTRTTHLTFQQTAHGLPVFNANLVVNVAAGGQVINVGGGFVPGLLPRAPAPVPALDPVEAVRAAADQLDLHLTTPVRVLGPQAAGHTTLMVADGASQDVVTARLEYVATPGGAALAWNAALRTPDGNHWFNVHVNAANGHIVSLIDWMHGLDGEIYNVFARPVESPQHGKRSVVIAPYDREASPYGWHDTNGQVGPEFTDTRGNNVSAQAPGGYRPDGGPQLGFDFGLDLSQHPSLYRDAAVTNLYYWNNVFHDVHYRYGFTPAAGNFQANTYGQGGLGNDPVTANAQDGNCNNAFMGTPPDGLSPTMRMCLWTFANPPRDSGLDNGVIAHEYGHGVSNRLTGNANGLGAQQSGGMGEGWGDWWGLMFTQDDADEPLGGRGIGTYVYNHRPDGQGVRQYRYSFDMAIDPLTLGRYNQSQAVHFAGTIWASALWDINHLLTTKYGFNPDITGGYVGDGDAGNVLALRLVMDGLKLQPINPSFLQARDAILAADLALTGGVNQPEIWCGFGRRGFGASANDYGSSSRRVDEAFDIPLEWRIQVAATDPAEGAVVTAPLTRLLVTFNLPFDPNTVGTDDLVLSGGTVTSATVLDTYNVEYVLADVPAGDFWAYLGEGAVADGCGHGNLEFAVTMTVDPGPGPGGGGLGDPVTTVTLLPPARPAAGVPTEVVADRRPAATVEDVFARPPAEDDQEPTPAPPTDHGRAWLEDVFAEIG